MTGVGKSRRDRVVHRARALEWPAIVAAAALALALGYAGFARLLSDLGLRHGSWDILYRVLQLFTLESGSVDGPVGWQLQVARFLAPAVTMLTAVKALTALLRDEIRLLLLRRAGGHTVVCGVGRKGLLVAEALADRHERVVVIDNDEHSDYLRRLRERGLTVLCGDAGDVQVLGRARAGRARRVLAMCGDDAVNAQVALHCRELCIGRRGAPLDCTVHIVDGDLCRLLKEQELRGVQTGVRLEFFNAFESGARYLVGQFPPFSSADVTGSAPVPHVLVVGCGHMGANVVARSAREWWRAGAPAGRRLAISVVDLEAQARCDAIESRWPRLKESCDLVPIEVDVTSADFERADFLDGMADLRPPVSIAYVCLDDDSRALAAALVVRRRARWRAVPVVVRMTYVIGLASLVTGAGGCDGLHAFGVIDWVCDPDRLFDGTHETIARAIHAAYLANRRSRGETPAVNPALVPWEELSPALRESNRRQADHFTDRLAAIGYDVAPLSDWEAESHRFSDDEAEVLARMEHERWRKERSAEGWTWAPGSKDPRLRTSPYLVEWSELPLPTREENRAAARRLPHLLADVGLQVVRLAGPQPAARPPS